MGENTWYLIMAMLQQIICRWDPPHPVSGSTHCHYTARIQRGVQNGNTIVGGMTNPADLASLGSMMVQLFDVSENMTDQALAYLIGALCRLAEEAIEQIGEYLVVGAPLSRHDACWFPIIKILEVGLFNVNRLMVFWPIVTAHFIEVASHCNGVVREHGLDALGYYVFCCV